MEAAPLDTTPEMVQEGRDGEKAGRRAAQGSDRWKVAPSPQEG